MRGYYPYLLEVLKFVSLVLEIERRRAKRNNSILYMIAEKRNFAEITSL